MGGAFLRVWLLSIILLVPLIPTAPASTACASPANDCIDASFEWFGKPEWFSNVGATMEPGEPTSCDGATVQKSVWFMVEVLSPGTSDILRPALDASFYATLGIYQKDAHGALVQKACRTSWEDEGLHSPTTSVPCTPGFYWIQVGSMASAAGSFQLRDESVYRKFDLTLSAACPFTPTVPTEPRISNPTGGNGQISLSWTEPWWDGGYGATISHYRVHRADTCTGTFASIGTTAARSYFDTGLPAGTTKCYKVTAVNVAGEGPAEPPRAGTTWSVPSAPTDLKVLRAGQGELALSWKAGAAGPGPVISYRIESAASAAGPFVQIATVPASDLAYTDTGLGDGATVHYRVSATNAVGTGTPSAAASHTTWSIPGVPTDVAVRSQIIALQPISFDVTWKAPADATLVTHYRIYRATSEHGTATFAGEVTASKTTFTDSGRGVLVPYHYEVRAWNPAGEGTASARACAAWPLESPVGRC